MGSNGQHCAPPSNWYIIRGPQSQPHSKNADYSNSGLILSLHFLNRDKGHWGGELSDFSPTSPYTAPVCSGNRGTLLLVKPFYQLYREYFVQILEFLFIWFTPFYVCLYSYFSEKLRKSMPIVSRLILF